MFRAHVLIARRAQIVLYSIWYHHTYRWPSRAQIERGERQKGKGKVIPLQARCGPEGG